MSSALETENLRQIEMLNQRGGRTLSIVDVMRAGTITPEAAGFLLHRVAQGASVLTGAVPGGAGKSTLLADILGMLPAGEEIVTTPDDGAVRAALEEGPRAGRCYLCHEIGRGHWYGYLWAPTVARFLDLASNGARIAACLHADDPEQTREALVSRELQVTDEQFGRIGLMLLMALDRSGHGPSRVVDSIWTADGAGGHVPAYRRSRRSGELQECEGASVGEGQSRLTLAACQAFMAELLEGPAHLFEDVREAVVGFYEA